MDEKKKKNEWNKAELKNIYNNQKQYLCTPPNVVYRGNVIIERYKSKRMVFWP